MIKISNNNIIVFNNMLFFVYDNKYCLAYSYKKNNNNVIIYSYQIIKHL